MKLLLSNLKRFKLITFDCTGTLLYFKNPPHKQYLKTAACFGLEEKIFDEALMKANFRSEFKALNGKYPMFGKDTISYEKWWEQLVRNVFEKSSRTPLDPAIFSTIAQELIFLYKTDQCWEKFAKSNELIAALKDAGKVVGVISNFDPRLHDLIRNMKLPAFDFVLTSYEASIEKPNPEIFNLAVKQSKLNMKPKEALHIGNEIEKDFHAAKQANWSSVLINSTEDGVQPSFKNVEHFWNVITTEELNI